MSGIIFSFELMEIMLPVFLAILKHDIVRLELQCMIMRMNVGGNSKGFARASLITSHIWPVGVVKLGAAVYDIGGRYMDRSN
jgi:hypothetical protein